MQPALLGVATIINTDISSGRARISIRSTWPGLRKRFSLLLRCATLRGHGSGASALRNELAYSFPALDLASANMIHLSTRLGAQQIFHSLIHYLQSTYTVLNFERNLHLSPKTLINS